MKTTNYRVEYQGETWDVLSLGLTVDGKTFAHTSRGKNHKNGFYPEQICAWVATSKIAPQYQGINLSR